MKTLIFIRHAKSDWSNLLADDFDRGLNKRGLRDAPFMGDALATKNIKPDLILSSPAQRAKLTAIAIAKRLFYPEYKIVYDSCLYTGDIADVIKKICSIDESIETLMIFGHNPDMTDYVNFISGSTIGSIPTCAMAAMELKKDSWKSVGKNSAKLLFFDTPKKLRKLQGV
jgi:phosphohistidine phosphatase